MKSVILSIEEYLIQENALCVNLTAEQIKSIKSRVIENQYMDLLLTRAQTLSKYAHLSKIDILHSIHIPVLLQDVNLDDVKVDISCFEMPDGCIIEIDKKSGYFATNNDKLNWHQRVCNLFNI